jgi:hypothetical protein
VLLYFDWFGAAEELKEGEEKLTAACAEVGGVEYKGRYYPHNRKYHFAYLFEVESFQKLLEEVGKGPLRDYKKLTHGEFEILAGPLE